MERNTLKTEEWRAVGKKVAAGSEAGELGPCSRAGTGTGTGIHSVFVRTRSPCKSTPHTKNTNDRVRLSLLLLLCSRQTWPTCAACGPWTASNGSLDSQKPTTTETATATSTENRVKFSPFCLAVARPVAAVVVVVASLSLCCSSIVYVFMSSSSNSALKFKNFVDENYPTWPNQANIWTITHMHVGKGWSRGRGRGRGGGRGRG